MLLHPDIDDLQTRLECTPELSTCAGRVRSIPAFEPWAKVAGARVVGQGTTAKVFQIHANVRSVHTCSGLLRKRSHNMLP